MKRHGWRVTGLHFMLDVTRELYNALLEERREAYATAEEDAFAASAVKRGVGDSGARQLRALRMPDAGAEHDE